MNFRPTLTKPFNVHSKSFAPSGPQPGTDWYFQLCWITREEAKDLLLRNCTNNRSVSDKSAFAHAEDFSNDNHPATPQPIIIGKSGSVIDGQHRLTGIASSDTEGAYLQVCYNVDDELFEYIDRGRSRGYSTVLKLKGYEKSSYFLAAIKKINNLRLGYQRDFTPNSVTGIEQSISLYGHRLAEILDVVQNLPYHLMCRNSFFLFGFTLAHIVDRDKTMEFIHQYASGQNIHPGDSAGLLRDLITSLYIRSVSKSIGAEAFARQSVALCKHLEGKPIKRLTSNGCETYMKRLILSSGLTTEDRLHSSWLNHSAR